MQDKSKQRVLDAFLLVMRPIARILLRYGIGYREFAEVTKMALVDVSSSDFGLRDRPTNISRVAVMTGLTRKEIRRLRDKIATGDSSVSVKMTPFADVLHHWHAHSDFTDSNGNPRKLSFAEEENSFTSLVKKFGGDVPAGAMRTEMKRVGAIREEESGLLAVVERAYRANDSHESLVTMLVHGVYALLSNVAHNTDSNRADVTWANRIAFTKSLRASGTNQLRRITKDRIVDFAESIDDVFIAYESLQDDGGSDEDGNTVAVGIYYFEEHDDNAKYTW
jgi:hypothetical protein